jgi:hypothetical protein
MKPPKLIINWELWDIIPSGFGHGVELHDLHRGEYLRDTLIGFVEGYSYEHCLNQKIHIPMKGFHIKPDLKTTQAVIDNMKFNIEKVMKHQYFPNQGEEIFDGIIVSVNA